MTRICFPYFDILMLTDMQRMLSLAGSIKSKVIPSSFNGLIFQHDPWRYLSSGKVRQRQKVATRVAPRTYTESTPDRRSVSLLRFMIAPDPADAHRSQDDARHTQAHLHQGQQEQAPQNLAAGAHPAPGISPAPAGGRRWGGSPLLDAPRAALLYCFISDWKRRKKCIQA